MLKLQRMTNWGIFETQCICLSLFCVLQEILFPILTVLIVVSLTLLASGTKSKTTLQPLDVAFPVPATYILCSPNTSEISSLMNKMLECLKAPRPRLLFYPSAAEAEEAYRNLSVSAYTVVVGIHFDELVAPSSVNYTLRFRAQDIADTELLFNHECE